MRLGYIQYYSFGDYSMSKKCFEAAIQTCSTFEKRSHRINPFLVKLAEINFIEHNFKKSEEMVAAIIARPNDKDV